MGEKREKAIKFFQDMQECTYGNLEEVDMAIHALEQERNVIEELEKIRTKIEELKPNNPKFKHFIGETRAINNALEVIDNHIEELKGE